MTKWKHNNNTIEVLDCIMSAGKTTGIINWMKENPSNRYLYVSPLKSEVEERIPEACEALEFVFPSLDSHGKKSDCLLEMIKERRNIAFTHSLFTMMTEEHLQAIDQNNYTLIIDEEIDFINGYTGNYNCSDIMTLEAEGKVVVDEDNLGAVKWTWDDNFVDGSAYTRLKRLCSMGMLHCAKRDRQMMVLQLPVNLVKVTERTIVLTYLFKGGVMDSFIRMRGLDVIDFTEATLMRTEQEVKEQARKLIKITTTPTVNKVKKWSLSSTWYSKNATKEQLNVVSNAFRSACNKLGHYEEVAYTLRKDNLTGGRKINIRGYPADECYMAANIRATNAYAHKTGLVHGYNRFPMLSVSAYLSDYGFPVDDDSYALSELVQWVWRSAIRNYQEVNLVFLSARMEKLFKEWLEK